MDLTLEGATVRGIERLTGCHRDTVCRTLKRVGPICARDMDRRLSGIKCQTVEIDECWSYSGCKQAVAKHKGRGSDWGDTYVVFGLDRDSRAVVGHAIGLRDKVTAVDLVSVLKNRILGPFDIIGDEFKGFEYAVDVVIGDGANFAQIKKHFVRPIPPYYEGYRPGGIMKTEPVRRRGNPDLSRATTSHAERFNWTLRTRLRRFTRLSNGFSRSLPHHIGALSLFLWDYNFKRAHGAHKRTPAMALGVTAHPLVWDDLCIY